MTLCNQRCTTNEMDRADFGKLYFIVWIISFSEKNLFKKGDQKLPKLSLFLVRPYWPNLQVAGIKILRDSLFGFHEEKKYWNCLVFPICNEWWYGSIVVSVLGLLKQYLFLYQSILSTFSLVFIELFDFCHSGQVAIF